MKKPIEYAIWLNENCSMMYNAYIYKKNNQIYYLDSGYDMGELYSEFKKQKQLKKCGYS